MALHPFIKAILDTAREDALKAARDPRDADPTKSGMFRDHRCWKCDDGERPCVQGQPNQCEYPHARND